MAASPFPTGITKDQRARQNLDATALAVATSAATSAEVALADDADVVDATVAPAAGVYRITAQDP